MANRMKAKRVPWLESDDFVWPVRWTVSLDCGGDEHPEIATVEASERSYCNPSKWLQVSILVRQLKSD
jgi:hypothetical protein